MSNSERGKKEIQGLIKQKRLIMKGERDAGAFLGGCIEKGCGGVSPVLDSSCIEMRSQSFARLLARKIQKEIRDGNSARMRGRKKRKTLFKCCWPPVLLSSPSYGVKRIWTPPPRSCPQHHCLINEEPVTGLI